MARDLNTTLQRLEITFPILRRYTVDVAYLFGSRADGSAYPGSDYDLAFLFKDFNPQRHNITMAIAIQLELEEKFKAPVDIVFLQKAPVVLAFEVISKGIVFYSTDEDFRTDI